MDQLPSSATGPGSLGSHDTAAEEPEGAGAVNRSRTVPATTPAFVPVRAMEDILAERTRQIFQFGHTLEADQRQPLARFARQLSRQGLAVTEYIQFAKPALARRHAVVLAALCMALIDRIDGDDTPIFDERKEP